MADGAPACYFGNFVNELMIDVQTPKHADGLVAVSGRMIWLAEPGDVIALPARPSETL